MALSLASRNLDLSSIKLIAKADDAIDHKASDEAAYRSTMDVSKMSFVDGKQPTIFICNFKWDARAARIVANAQVAGKDDDNQPIVTMGSWAHAIAKVSIKAIENPSTLPVEHQVKLTRDANGHLDEKTLGLLEEFGVIDDCFAAWVTLTKKKPAGSDAKN